MNLSFILVFALSLVPFFFWNPTSIRCDHRTSFLLILKLLHLCSFRFVWCPQNFSLGMLYTELNHELNLLLLSKRSDGCKDKMQGTNCRAVGLCSFYFWGSFNMKKGISFFVFFFNFVFWFFCNGLNSPLDSLFFFFLFFCHGPNWPVNFFFLFFFQLLDLI